MSGLCGWIGHGISAPENLQLVRRMAEPLSRFDRSSIKSVSGKQSAAALAAPEGSVHLYQKEGLTVAIWGSPVFREKHYNQLALSEGIAKTLADQWRSRRTDIFSGLEGAFSICILDEDAAEAVLATDRMGSIRFPSSCRAKRLFSDQRRIRSSYTR